MNSRWMMKKLMSCSNEVKRWDLSVRICRDAKAYERFETYCFCRSDCDECLYRPGPMEYIPSFIRRKHGEERSTYDLPEMEEYLKDLRDYGLSGAGDVAFAKASRFYQG